MPETEEGRPSRPPTDPTVGQVLPYAGSLTNAGEIERLRRHGWLPCDGSSHPDALYPSLSRLIKGIYGQGDQPNEFRVPDLRGRVPVGSSPARSLADSGGEETVTLTPENLPPHTHRYDRSEAEGESYSEKTERGEKKLNRGKANTDNGPGQALPFSVMQPYLVLHFLIRADQPPAASGDQGGG